MSNNIGNTLDGHYVRGPYTIQIAGSNPQNFDGDNVTIMGVCQSVSSTDVTGTATVLLKSSQVNVTIPLVDVRGHRAHALPVVNDQTVSTGKVTAITGNGSTAQLTVLLTNSQTTITVAANDCYASQSV